MNKTIDGLLAAIQQFETQSQALKLAGRPGQSILDLIWVTDVSHNLVYVSPSAEQLLGVSPSAALGKPPTAFIHESDIDKFQELLNSITTYLAKDDLVALRSLSVPAQEILLVDGRGRAVATETTISMRFDRDNRFQGLYGIVRDVTDRKKLEAELHRNQALMRKVFDTTPEAISLMNMSDDTYIDVNEGFVRLTGWDRNEVIGRTPADINVWVDENERNQLVQQLQTSEMVTNFEATFRRKDGSLTTGLMSITGFQVDGEGYVISSARDIGALKKAQEENAEMEKQLLQAQRVESLGTLAGGIAHNFNNILMAIQGNASLLELEIDDVERRREYLRTIDRLIDDAADLTNQLLAFGRPVESRLIAVDINQLILEQAKLFGRTYPGIAISIEPCRPPVHVNADPNQLNQVLLNLFMNARDAMDQRGNLRVATKVMSINRKLAERHDTQPGEYLVLDVEDQGSGMDKNTLEHMFDPFFTTKPPGKGTGLGLASVHNIIRNHRGFMKVISEPGNGSTFSIFLPISKSPAIATPTLPLTATSGQGTVLVVDDDRTVLQVTANILDTLGYTVMTAESGQQALDMVSRGEIIDLVILDMVMPKMDGVEACRKLRELRPELKIILSSGYHDNADELGEARFDGVIHKPFKLAQLSKLVKDTIDKRTRIR